MKTFIVVLLSSIFLIGCAKPKPQIVYRTETVEVPVYQIPKFEIPERPVLPIDQLTPEDKGDYELVGKTYRKSVNVLKGFATSLEQTLEGIKKGEQ